MAKLSDADMKTLLGENYTPPVETQASRDEQRTIKRATYRKAAIGIAFVILVMLVASYFRT